MFHLVMNIKSKTVQPPTTQPMMMLSRRRRLLMSRMRLLRPGTWLAVVIILDVMSCSVDRCDARSARVAYAWLQVVGQGG